MLTFVDRLIYLDMSPTEFKSLDETSQRELDEFIAGVLDGRLKPKRPKDDAVE